MCQWPCSGLWSAQYVPGYAIARRISCRRFRSSRGGPQLVRNQGQWLRQGTHWGWGRRFGEKRAVAHDAQEERRKVDERESHAGDKITSTAHTRTHTTSTTHDGTNAVRMRKCGKCGVGAPGRPRTTGTSTERARARPRSRRPLTAGTGLRAQRADGARQSGRRRPSPQSRPGLAIHRKRVGSHARQSPVDERKSAVVAFVW
jgi:hypothetical protein